MPQVAEREWLVQQSGMQKRQKNSTHTGVVSTKKAFCNYLLIVNSFFVTAKI